jgi:hypothetical protein
MTEKKLEEPSVLDYLKAKLTPWRGPAPEIPAADAIPQAAKAAAPAKGRAKAAVQAQARLALNIQKLPWRIFLGLLLALLAQRAFEPPDRGVTSGIFFYLIALGLVIWSNWQNEFSLYEPKQIEVRDDPMTVKRVPVIVGFVFCALAFVTFGGNRFTFLNVLFWLAGLAYFVIAFWVRNEERIFIGERMRGFLAKPSWNIQITRWTLLVAAVAGISIFFRMYQLDSLPPDMTSDHVEKLLDVYDITQGQASIFFIRNTGREGLQFYLTALVGDLFNTGVSFLSLKLGTVLVGLLSLPFIYLLGKEIGNRWVGLIAVLLAGISLWPNILARIALRFILYPAFVAPSFYFLFRGLRTSNRNDFILSGIFLSIGLHGYSPTRVLPFVIMVAVILFILHRQSAGKRFQALLALGVVALFALLVFLPLGRYLVENPDTFNYRTLTRITELEQPFPEPPATTFFKNLWNALRMVNWYSGNIWTVGVDSRPAVDLVTASLFLIGSVLLLVRYLRRQHWLDLFLLISVPLLMMPSILSLAFPNENPALNRASGAMVPVFLIAALALEGLLRGIRDAIGEQSGARMAAMVGVVLFAWAGLQNYGLVFDRYRTQYLNASWNSSEMGAIIGEFTRAVGSAENAWVVAFPHWVDTRAVGMQAGYTARDYGIWPDRLNETVGIPGPKLFLYKPEDAEGARVLQSVYPQGTSTLFESAVDSKDFYMYFVPPQ